MKKFGNVAINVSCEIQGSKKTKKQMSSKKTKKQKREKKTERDEEKFQWQYRGNLVSLIRLLKDVEFTSKQEEQIRKTPFWSLIQCISSKKLMESMCKKCDDTLLQIVKTYNVMEEKFRLGKELKAITENDITLIFGIQVGEQEINVRSPKNRPKNSAFVKRRFPNDDRMTSSLIKIAFHEAVKGKTKKDIEDVARLLTLFLCVNIFFPTTSESLSWGFIKYAEKLDEMKKYRWSKAVLDSLLDSLEKKSRSSPEKVTGCVTALLYWLCEHTTIVPASDSEDNIPRLLKWKTRDVTESLQRVPLKDLTRSQVKMSPLQPTEKERQVLELEIDDGEEQADDDEKRQNSDDNENSDEMQEHYVDSSWEEREQIGYRTPEREQIGYQTPEFQIAEFVTPATYMLLDKSEDDRIEEIQMENQKVIKTRDEALQKVKDLEEDNDHFRSHITEKDCIIQSLEKSIKILEDEKSTQLLKLEMANQYMEKMEYLQKDNEILQSQILGKDESVQRLHVSKERIQHLEKENEDFRKLLIDKDSTIQRFQNTVKKIAQDNNQNLQYMEKENQYLKQQLHAKDQELNTLHELLEKIKQEKLAQLIEFETKMATDDIENEEMRKEMERLQQKISQMEADS